MTIKGSLLPPSTNGWVRAIASHGGKIALFAALLAVWWIALPQMRTSFDAAVRYGPSYKSEWAAMDYWINSAACARRTGVPLVMCEGDRLVPFSDRSVADDPGHALVLGILARIVDRDVSYIDIARINLCINAAGIAVLVALLLGLRLYWAAFLFLILGPSYFLRWFGPSPHWSFIGLTAMQVVLPLALIALDRRWISRRLGIAYVVVGILAIAFAALVREAVATMAVMVTFAVLLWLAFGRVRRRQPIVWLGVVAALAFGAHESPAIAYSMRDMVANVEPAKFGGRHGMAHTLYIGLGTVPNRLGIVYSDEFGYRTAQAIAPGVASQSAEYLRIMRGLYLQQWLSDPVEVIRIYVEKFRMVMAYRFLDHPALSLWGSLLLIGAIHLLSNRGRLSCGQPACDVRLGVSLIALAFIGLVVLQSVLAMPTQYYAMPIGPLLLLLFGVSVENLAGAARRAVGHRFLPAA